MNTQQTKFQLDFYNKNKLTACQQLKNKNLKFTPTFSIITSMNLTETIKQKAIEIGFDLIGITDTSPIDSTHAKHLTDWLNNGFPGQMSYMHKNFNKRTKPAELLKNAKSVICTAINYKPSPDSPKPKSSAPTGKISTYAQYTDYHTFVKNKLHVLASFIASIAADTPPKFKICVDSAPVAERSLAARAGLGFIGKNHILINPHFGLQLFLGEIITDLDLQTDIPIDLHCAHCNKCLNACPTAALRLDGQFDATRCISYLTIEHKDRIPPDLAPKVSARLFGCDECILACPYQKKAPACKNTDFKFYPDRAELNLKKVLNFTEEEFETEFADSVINRPGLAKLKANAQTCLDNIV